MTQHPSPTLQDTETKPHRKGEPPPYSLLRALAAPARPERPALAFCAKARQHIEIKTIFTELQRLWLLQAGKCSYCQRLTTLDHIRQSNSATRDHVLPSARGGISTMGNYVMACFRCNNLKGTTDAVAFRACIAVLEPEEIPDIGSPRGTFHTFRQYVKAIAKALPPETRPIAPGENQPHQISTAGQDAK